MSQEPAARDGLRRWIWTSVPRPSACSRKPAPTCAPCLLPLENQTLRLESESPKRSWRSSVLSRVASWRTRAKQTAGPWEYTENWYWRQTPETLVLKLKMSFQSSRTNTCKQKTIGTTRCKRPPLLKRDWPNNSVVGTTASQFQCGIVLRQWTRRRLLRDIRNQRTSLYRNPPAVRTETDVCVNGAQPFQSSPNPSRFQLLGRRWKMRVHFLVMMSVSHRRYSDTHDRQRRTHKSASLQNRGTTDISASLATSLKIATLRRSLPSRRTVSPSRGCGSQCLLNKLCHNRNRGPSTLCGKHLPCTSWKDLWSVLVPLVTAMILVTWLQTFTELHMQKPDAKEIRPIVSDAGPVSSPGAIEAFWRGKPIRTDVEHRCWNSSPRTAKQIWETVFPQHERCPINLVVISWTDSCTAGQEVVPVLAARRQPLEWAQSINLG